MEGPTTSRRTAGVGLALVGAVLFVPPSAVAQERGLKKVVVPETGPTLSVRANSMEAGRPAPLVKGGKARTGAWIEFLARLDRPAYLSVLQFHPDGSAEILYPDEAPAAQTVGEVRVPEAGSWFELVGDPGDEKVFFVATARPLPESDPRLSEIVERVRKLAAEPSSAAPEAARATAAVPPPTKAAPPRPALPPPDAFGLATRGRLVKVQVGTGGPEDAVAAGNDGVAILQFDIDHVTSP